MRRNKGENIRTFKSYRPTRWSADTDRAIERSSETDVAMTVATVLRESVS